MGAAFQYTDTLALLRDRLKELDDDYDNLDKKAQDNIQSITIIFAFASAFKIFERTLTILDIVLMVGVFVVYVFVVVLSYYNQAPKAWKQLVGTDEEAIVNYVKTRTSEEDYCIDTIRACSRAIKVNEETLRLKNIVQNIVRYLIFINIFAIILIIAF